MALEYLAFILSVASRDLVGTTASMSEYGVCLLSRLVAVFEECQISSWPSCRASYSP
jgi:hypothetical protein